MKSQSDNLYQIVSDICKDVRAAYPTLKGLDLDLERLSLLVSSRGLGCFTLDLPARESALIRGLETGLLDAKGTTRYSKHYPVPRLFAGLYMRIFDRDLCLKADADVNAILFLRQLLVIGKKIENPNSLRREQMLQSQAIKDYVNVEQQMVRPTLQWGSDSLDYHGGANRVHFCDDLGANLPLYPEYNIGRSAGEKLLLQRCQRFADFVAAELGTFCPDCFIEARRAEGRRPGFRHGPGAVAERGGRFFDKFRFSNWSTKLSTMYPWETSGKMPNDERCRPQNHEVPARLICVPKTAKGPRIIAAEPSEHMFTQNLFADWLIERINSTGLSKYINLRDQAASGRLVLKASASRELATIDLSSASDRLSLWVVERMFRSNPSILRAIHATRTRWLRLPNGECIELKKFASQGTALTFPVQTIVFWIIAMAASHDSVPSWTKVKHLEGKVRVYGDDIIVPNTRYADVVVLLTALHLKVNQEKSFSRGYFRESCGVDAFKGYDVTPLKPKTTTTDNPASCQAVIDLANNLFYKGYWNASYRLEHRQRSRSQFRDGIVGRDAGATGYVSYSFDTFMRRTGRISGYRGIRQSRCFRTRLPSGVFSTPHGLLVDRNADLLVDLGFRIRFNPKLQRFEVRYRAFSQVAKYRPYDCGYSGLLQRQLQPPQVQGESLGLRGVPERPALREVSRWEALESLYSRS